MRTPPLLTAIALAAWALAGTAQAAPRGSIECPMRAISGKDRAALGASMIKDANAADALTAAHDFIAGVAKPCARANGWGADQIDNAIAWAEWKLMADELQRESGLTAADLTIMRAYVDADATRAGGLDHLSSFQRTKLFDDLHQRGVRLRDGGDTADQTLEVMILLHEMRVQEAAFARS